MEDRSRVAKNAGIVSISVLISRITGLIREMVIAGVFGAGSPTDAFFVAFRIPYTLRQLFAEGGMNVAFIPVLSEVRTKGDKRKVERFVGNVLVTFSLALFIIIGFVELFPEFVVKLFAFGFSKDPTTYQLTLLLTRMVFPYIWLISMVVLLGGVLNTYGYFFAPAISQALLNISMAAFGYFLGRYQFGLNPIVSLAYGVLVGGFLQLILQVVYFPRTRLNVYPHFNLKDPYLREVGRLLLPAALGMMVYQLNTLVSTQLASFLPKGSVSFLYYGDRLMQLPIGVFSFAISTAALPSLSLQSASSEHDRAASLLSFSMKLNFLLVFPVMLLYFFLSDQIVDILYRRGAFTLNEVKATGSVLRLYSIGLWSAASVRVLAPYFYARKEPYVPLKSGIISLVLNLTLGIILMKYLSYRGLALSIAVASMGNFIFLWIMASKRHELLGFRKFRGIFLKLLVASAGGVFVLFLMQYLWNYPVELSVFFRLFWLFSISTLVVLVYFGLTIILGIEESLTLLKGIGRRLGIGKQIN